MKAVTCFLKYFISPTFNQLVGQSHVLKVFLFSCPSGLETLCPSFMKSSGLSAASGSLSCVTMERTCWREQEGHHGDPCESASHFRVCAQLLHVPVVWVCPSCACAFLLHVLLEGSSGPDLVALPSGERPFHCTLCEKAFNQKSALQVHMKKHTGERPYKCDYCVMGFTQKSNMKLHMKRAHSYTGEAPVHTRLL